MRIHGQVETTGEPETVEGLIAKVISLAANMGVTLKRDDISISHRLPARAADRQVCAEEHKSKHDAKHASEASGRCARTQVDTACTLISWTRRLVENAFGIMSNITLSLMMHFHVMKPFSHKDMIHQHRIFNY